MRIRNWIGLLGAALVVSGCAGGGGPPPGFEDDGPGDGPPGPRTQLFISPAGQPFRAPAGEPYPVAAWFAAADRDHEGRLTRDEFRADADAWFKALDANGDGRIDMPEATRWEEQLVPEITRTGLGMSAGGPRTRNTLDTRRQGAAAYSLISEPHPVRGADADLSFSVSPAEWRAASDRRFALLDPDGDGAVLPTDLRPTPIQAMRGGGERRGGGRPPMRRERPR